LAAAWASISPVVKLLDYQDLEALLADPNPFALVTAAPIG